MIYLKILVYNYEFKLKKKRRENEIKQGINLLYFARLESRSVALNEVTREARGQTARSISDV